MFYADEIRSTEDIEVPADGKIGDRELKMAKSLVEMLTGDFEPEKYQDNYREALLELIEAKAEGQEISRPAPVVSKVTDLMEALRASVENAKRERAGGGEEEEEEAPRKRASRSAREDREEAKPARRRKAG
jgi:DNA end-binding protein Ku